MTGSAWAYVKVEVFEIRPDGSRRRVKIGRYRMRRALTHTCGVKRDRASARCRYCNPAGNPRKLRADGREYRRRAKARRRRGR